MDGFLIQGKTFSVLTVRKIADQEIVFRTDVTRAYRFFRAAGLGRISRTSEAPSKTLILLDDPPTSYGSWPPRTLNLAT
jgi:hypothetical protein